MRRRIWCASCRKFVEARLTDYGSGSSNGTPLSDRPVWQCPSCGNFVFTRYNTSDPTAPVGIIGDKRIRILRKAIHEQINAAQDDTSLTTSQCYDYISNRLGCDFHAGKISTVDGALKALKIAKQLNKKRILIDLRYNKRGE